MVGRRAFSNPLVSLMRAGVFLPQRFHRGGLRVSYSCSVPVDACLPRRANLGTTAWSSRAKSRGAEFLNPAFRFNILIQCLSSHLLGPSLEFSLWAQSPGSVLSFPFFCSIFEFNRFLSSVGFSLSVQLSSILGFGLWVPSSSAVQYLGFNSVLS